MSFNIAKQGLLLAILTLLLITITTMVSMSDVTVVPSNLGIIGSSILDFQNNNPIWSSIISSILIILTGFGVGRLTVRYNLYVNSSSLAIPIYGVFACGIVMIDDYLIAYIISYLLMFAIKLYFLGYKLTKYGFDSIFKGSLILGLMPYIYPASILLILLIPISILQFRRSSKEFIVSVSGFILPSLLISYTSWMLLDEPWVYILNLKESILQNITTEVVWYLPIYTLIVLGCYTLIFLVSCYYYMKNRYCSSTKALNIVIFNIYLLLSTVVMLFMPAATTAVFALIAVPVAMFIPIALVNFKNIIALTIYALLLTSSLLRIVFL